MYAVHATRTSGHSYCAHLQKDAPTDEDTTSCGVLDSTNSDASVGSLDWVDASGSGAGGGAEGNSIDGSSQASDSKVWDSDVVTVERYSANSVSTARSDQLRLEPYKYPDAIPLPFNRPLQHIGRSSLLFVSCLF